MSFRFKKLYADLVGEDGTVCITYLAWLEVLGSRSTFAGLELYSPDGTRQVVRARPRSHAVDATGIEIELEVPGGTFRLHQRSLHHAWMPSGQSAHPAIHWSVVTARAESEGELCTDGTHSRWRGIGYADWVEIRRPTRMLGLGLLQWGRLHLPDETIVFNGVRLRSGQQWKRVAHWSTAGEQEEADFAVTHGHRAMTLMLPGADASPVHVLDGRTLHSGDPIDPQRFPGIVERTLSAVITGRAVEDRRVGRVRRPGAKASGWAVYETVRFGAQS
jgi:hypothetical protein